MPAPIPYDLQADILVRLPVKSLLRFRCVSRSWKSLINSSGFISKHNENTDNYFHLLHWYKSDQAEKLGPHEFGDSFTEFTCAEFPSQVKSIYYRLVLDCNGLILFVCEYFGHILWNPAVRKSMTLPRPCIRVPSFSITVYGFGFDQGSNDYKVLKILQKEVVGHSNLAPLRAELYNLQTGAWKMVKVDEDFGCRIKCPTHSFVNGASHWLGSNASLPGFNRVVMVFDMCDEEFRSMKLPGCLTGTYLPDLCIGVSGGLLSLISYDRGPEGILSCSVWLLKEYGIVESWTICATIDLSDWGVLRRSLFSFRNKEEIMFETSRNMLVLFDLKTKRITDLGMKIEGHGHTMNTYKESLVLLNDGRATSENRFCSKKRMRLAGLWGWLRKVTEQKQVRTGEKQMKGRSCLPF